MVALREQKDLGGALSDLAGALEALELGPDLAALAADRDRLAGSIRSYLVPRTIDPTTPVMVVLAGPTGSGKSTMINSLSGLDVSKTGALRPTTRAPVVLCRSSRTAGYRRIGGVPCEVVSGAARILDDMVLVDAPDLDSTATDHRAMAEILIDNADIVVLVTSALRYADDVPWQVLRRAVSRGTPVINVLNRVQSASSGGIVDYKSRLREARLDDDLIMVPEHHLAEGAQQVPSTSIQVLRHRLGEVVANRDEFAGEVRERVLRSVVDQVTGLVHSLSSIEDDMQTLEAELGARLASRVGGLELEGIGSGMSPQPPDPSSRRAVRRWRRRAQQLEEEKVGGLESKLVDRIVSLVHADLRHWLVEEGADLRDRNIDPVAVISDGVEQARSQLEGWVDFVGRIAADHDSRDLALNKLVLLEASTFEQAIPATTMAFGDEGLELVARARRELLGRISAIYGNTAETMVDSVRWRQGRLDDDLRDALSAVTSRFAPEYA